MIIIFVYILHLGLLKKLIQLKLMRSRHNWHPLYGKINFFCVSEEKKVVCLKQQHGK